MVLNAVKLFSRLSQDLHNRCGNNSSRSKEPPWISSAAASNARLAFAKRLLQCVASFAELHSLQELGFTLPDDIYTFFGVWGWPPLDIVWTPLDLSDRNVDLFWRQLFFLPTLASVETNLILSRPSPKRFVCHLQDSGRHVTSVCQGLSSLALGGGEKETLGTRLYLTMGIWPSSC